MSTAPAEVADQTSYARVVDAMAAAGVIAGTPGEHQAYGRCPGHDDTQPSLSITWKINRKGGGETFVSCKGGCDRHDVLAAVGLVDSDRYDTPPFGRRGYSPRVAKRRGGAGGEMAKVAKVAKVAKSSPRHGEADGATGGEDLAMAKPVANGVAKPVAKGSPRGGTGRGFRPLATYVYRDGEGNPVYQILRWPFEDGAVVKYSCRRYVNGRFVKAKANLADEEKVLYNLPEVLASAPAAGGAVWLCEGEKDAEAVSVHLDRGGPSAASTMPYGAKAWMPQYAASLRGKFVKVVVDRDEDGYKRGLLVLDELEPVAYGVEILEPAAGKDAHDHLAAGYGLGDLVTLTRQDLVARLAAITGEIAEAGEAAGEETGEGSAMANGAAKPVASAAAVATVSPLPTAPGGEPDGGEGGEGGEVRQLFPDAGDGGEDGGDAGHGGGGGGGGRGEGGDGIVRQAFVQRDRYVDDPFVNGRQEQGLYKLKTEMKRNRDGDITHVTETYSELLPVRVQLAGRWVEDLCDGSPALMTHVDLLASRDGETHTMRSVELDRWKNCSWVNELPWAAPYQDTGSGRSTLRNAILHISGDVPLTVMYGVLGWQKIAGRWVYLHAGGGIDANGPVSDVRVKLDEPLQPFELPASPSTRAELRDALMASVALFEAVPDRVAAPVLGAAYRAPLGFSRTTVMPFGPKGSGKTGVAAFAVQHGAPSARHDQMPGAGAGEDAGTTTALEELRYRAGDVLLPLDDLAPDRGTERASVRCAIIARSQFNRTGKARGKRDGGIRPMHPPRSLPLVTGEETTTVESAESRIVTVKVGRGDVKLDDLELLDDNGDPMRRAALTASMIRHYAPVKETLDDTLRAKRAELAAQLRDANPVDPGLDTRHSESVADLAVGWWAMLAMAKERHAITAAEHDAFWSRAWAGLAEAKRHLIAGGARRTAGDRVRELMRTLLMQGKATLKARDGVSAPSGIEALCGWEQDPVNQLPGVNGGPPLPIWRERGEAIGWTDGEVVWLNPGAAHAALVAQSKREHDELTYTGRGLGEALADAGVISTALEAGIRRVAVKAPRIGASSRPRVWEMQFGWLFDDEGDDEDGTPAAPTPAPAAPAPIDTNPMPSAPAPKSNPTTSTTPTPAAPAPSSAGSSTPAKPAASTKSSTSTGKASTCATGKVQHKSTGKAETGWWDAGKDATGAPRQPYGAVAAVVEPGAAWLAVPGAADPTRLELEDDVQLSALMDALVAARLGHRDGRGRFKGAPHAWGQTWITPELRKALGWPESVETAGKAKKVKASLEAAGWKILGNVGGPWLRVARETDDVDQHARLVLMVPEWGDTPTAMNEDDPAPAELARRLARYAETTGIAWQWSPGASGQQLVAVTRPRLLGDRSAETRQGPELPLQAGRGSRERDFLWQRPPTAEEEKMPYVMLLDANAMYLSAAVSLPLAWGEYEHVDAPAFDKNRPGYWKINAPRWDHPVLPDPLGPVAYRGERDTLWVTTPTLETLVGSDMLDWQVEILEANLAVDQLREAPEWPYAGKPPVGDGWRGQKGSGRLLRHWAESLRDARTELLGAEPGSTDDVVLSNVKGTYAHGIGRLDRIESRPGEGERRSSHPLWRPDFRHAVIAQSRYALFRKVLKTFEATGRAPLAINIDGLVYATNELPDPSSSAGIPEAFTIGAGLGQFTLDGVTRMDAVADMLRKGRQPARSTAGKSRGLIDTIRAGLEG